MIAALAASVVVLAAEYVTTVSTYFQKNWLSMLVVFVITFVTTFLIFSYLLEVFIYRKIKLIYKTISTFKDSKEKALERVDLDADILGNVSKEVMGWEKDRTEEIEQLKRQELFRREFWGTSRMS